MHAALLATAFVPAKALYTVTALGVADALEEGPQHVSQLAARAGVQDDALRRILRAVAAHGIFDEVRTALVLGLS